MSLHVVGISERARRREKHRNPENPEAVARHIFIERKKKKKRQEKRKKERRTSALTRWTFPIS